MPHANTHVYFVDYWKLRLTGVSEAEDGIS